MSTIQAAMNSAIGSLGVASALYQQTPQYQERRAMEEATRNLPIIEEKLGTTSEALKAHREGKETYKGTEEAWNDRLAALQNEYLGLQAQKAGFQEQAGEFGKALTTRSRVYMTEQRLRRERNEAAQALQWNRSDAKREAEDRIAALEGDVRSLDEALGMEHSLRTDYQTRVERASALIDQYQKKKGGNE